MTGWLGPQLLWVASGTLVSLGILLLVTPPTDRPAAWWTRIPRHVWLRVGAGLLAGVTMLVLTGWIAAGIGVGAAVAAWPVMFGGATEQRAHISRLEALAGWVESLRDAIATSRGLPEALPEASRRVNSALAGPMQDLVARMAAREPLETSLRQLADAIDDPIADQVIAALLLNVRAQGKELKAVLSSLASATRREVDTRRKVEAERRSTRRDTTIIMTCTVVFTLLLTVAYPQYREAFSTTEGQLLLGVAVLLFAAGFVVLRQLSKYVTPDRFLLERGVPR